MDAGGVRREEDEVQSRKTRKRKKGEVGWLMKLSIPITHGPPALRPFPDWTQLPSFPGAEVSSGKEHRISLNVKH